MKLNSFIIAVLCFFVFSCDEDSLIVQPIDCNGVTFGNAQEDNCGVCDEDPLNDCSQDCAGNWGGQSTEDLCGVCDGDSSICSDCFGIPNGDGLVDFDGNCYETIEIGNQIWMAENLKVSHYNNGNQIPSDFLQIPNNDYNNFELYGFLYTPDVIFDQNICPVNWHVPTDDEWIELEMFLGMGQVDAEDTGYRGVNEGAKLASNAELWNNQADWGETGFLEDDPEFGSSGFNAIPAGNCGGWHMGGLIPEGTSTCYFWTSTSDETSPDQNFLYYRAIDDHSTTIWRHSGEPDGVFNCASFRCIKD